MLSILQLVVAASAIRMVLAQTPQYNDGYENVNLPTDPVQIRLAYQGPSAMMVSWNTFEQLSNPTVSYGTDPSMSQSASSSVSITYPTSLTYNNHVNITGLLPYTTYYYLPQYSNATTPYTFTTARAAGDTTPFTVGVVVDMGTFGPLGLSTTVGTGAANPLRPNEQTTITALGEMINNYEFLVHAGDIAYADAWLKEEIGGYIPTTTTAQGAVVYESILNAFYDELSSVTALKPYMVNPGNHEANCDNGGTSNKVTGAVYTEADCLVGQTNFTGYINHWRMPSGPSGGVGNMWYSYDYGLVHFVHISTETDLGNGVVGPDEGSTEFGGPFGTYNQQINWLTNDLASVNRTLTPWVVVFGHRGWYLSSTSNPTCQTAFENLFYTYGVDVYVNGHAHLYERTVPIFNNVIDPNGLSNPKAPLYLTNGAAGHYDGLDTFKTIQPYSAYHTVADYSWATLNFLNRTHMILNGLWSANNTVFDTAMLYKAHALTSGSTSTSSLSSSSLSSSTSLSSVSSLTPTATINTATTTSTAVYPTYTNFNGLGHLLIYTGGLLEGDIGSAGTWYNTPGQSTATYTAVPLYANGTAFLLQHSAVYCAVSSQDSSFNCAAIVASAASVFGQTPDGNLTYNGSPAFYAPSAASSGAKPTVYVTSMAVSMNIVWNALVTAVPSTSTSTSSQGASTTPSSQSVSTSSSSSPPPSTTSTSSSVSATGVSVITITNSVPSPYPTTIVSTDDISFTTTLPASTLTENFYFTSTQQASTETDNFYFTSTQPASTETDDFYFTSTLPASTETDDFYFTSTLPASTETDNFYFTSTLPASTETDNFYFTSTLPASTETDNFYFTSTQISTVTQITTTTAVTTIISGVPTTLASTLTLLQTNTATSSYVTTLIQQASTITSLLPASTVTYTQPGSITTVTKPASTITKYSTLTSYRFITDTLVEPPVTVYLKTKTQSFTTTKIVSLTSTQTLTVTRVH